MIESFPCATCEAACCGPVALSADRMEKILAFVRAMSQAERKRLAAQKRRPIDCRFLDKKNYRCVIYPVRPWVCEAFGRVKGMQCQKLSGLVQILPAFLEDTGVDAEYESGIVGNSCEFDWPNFESNNYAHNSKRV